MYGIFSNPIHSGSGLITLTYGYVAEPTNNVDGTMTYLTGIILQPIQNSTGAVNTIRGVWANNIISATGNITVSESLYANINISAASVVASHAGLHVGTPTIAGGGSIGTNYGILIDDQSASGTTKYALYSLGGNVSLYNADILITKVTGPCSLSMTGSTGGAATAGDILASLTMKGSAGNGAKIDAYAEDSDFHPATALRFFTCAKDGSQVEAARLNSTLDLIVKDVNSFYLKTGVLTDVPVSTTKTVTVTAAGNAHMVAEVTFSFIDMAGGATGIGRLKVLWTGYPANAANYDLTDLERANSGTVVIGATTDGATCFTFTVQNTDASNTVGVVYSYTATQTLTVTIA
jgi:hypothetical protein